MLKITLLANIYMLIIVYNFSSVNTLIYPVTKDPKWVVVNYKNLVCPQGIYGLLGVFDNLHSQPFVRRQMYDPNNCVEGYTSKKIIYSTSCYRNWHFNDIINKKISHHNILKSECEESVRNFLDGGLSSIGFKTPICNWCTENTVENSEILVTRHPVVQDPYSEDLVDPIFPSGRLSRGEYRTIHDDVIWIPSGAWRSSLCVDMPEKEEQNISLRLI